MPPHTFTAVLAPAEGDGYVAYCLEGPAVGRGDTIEACRAALRVAVQRTLAERRAVERQKAPPDAWEEGLDLDDIGVQTASDEPRGRRTTP
jgi:hypothetical protein